MLDNLSIGRAEVSAPMTGAEYLDSLDDGQVTT
jgi:hypothetical protein